MSNLYYWYKDHGICPMCRSNNAFPNRVFCAECLEKKVNYNIKSRSSADKRQQYNKTAKVHKKLQREERKAKGLCTRCGKKKSQKGQLCIDCWAHRQVYREREKVGKLRRGQHFRERKERGVCLYCEGEIVPGKCFCDKHLKQIQETLEKSKEKRTEVWKKQTADEWKIALAIHQQKIKGEKGNEQL